MVPWFLTRGYFVEKVLSEQFKDTPIPVRILDPIGARAEIVQLMRSRAKRLAEGSFRFRFRFKRAIEGLLGIAKSEGDGRWEMEDGIKLR